MLCVWCPLTSILVVLFLVLHLLSIVYGSGSGQQFYVIALFNLYMFQTKHKKVGIFFVFFELCVISSHHVKDMIWYNKTSKNVIGQFCQ